MESKSKFQNSLDVIDNERLYLQAIELSKKYNLEKPNEIDIISSEEIKDNEDVISDLDDFHLNKFEKIFELLSFVAKSKGK